MNMKKELTIIIVIILTCVGAGILYLETNRPGYQDEIPFLLILGANAFLGWLLQSQWIVPIHELREKTDQLSSGHLDVTFEELQNPEIRRIYQNLNRIQRRFLIASDLVRMLEAGELHEATKKFSNRSDSDKLTSALRDLSRKLQNIANKEEQEKWKNVGLSKFVDIFNARYDKIQDFYDTFLGNLVRYLEANQAGIFLKDDQDPDQLALNLEASYAFDRKKFLKKRVLPGEGLVGQIFLEQKTFYMRSVPKDYLRVTSGLGDAHPASLIVIPLIYNEEILGILELASLQELEPFEIDFLERLCENLSSNISKVKTNQLTQSLLYEAQRQTEQLRAQEEEMRQNMEELQATQEKLQSEQNRLENLSQELKAEKGIFDSFLQTTPSSVYFKNLRGEFIRVSDSVVKAFGLQDSSEIIGKTDFDFFAHEFAYQTTQDEQQIIETKVPIIDKEEQTIWEDGHITWVLTSKFPLYNSQNELIGIFGITRDISQMKDTKQALEFEEGLLEAFLSNAPQLIYFKDMDGRFIRVSQSLARFLGADSPQEIIGKTDQDLFAAQFAARNQATDEKVMISGTPVIGIPLKDKIINGQDTEVISYKFPIVGRKGEASGIFGIYEQYMNNRPARTPQR